MNTTNQSFSEIDTSDIVWNNFDMDDFDANLSLDEWHDFLISYDDEFDYAFREIADFLLSNWTEETREIDVWIDEDLSYRNNFLWKFLNLDESLKGEMLGLSMNEWIDFTICYEEEFNESVSEIIDHFLERYLDNNGKGRKISKQTATRGRK